MTDKTKLIKITENNDWEGETWHFYITKTKENEKFIEEIKKATDKEYFEEETILFTEKELSAKEIKEIAENGDADDIDDYDCEDSGDGEDGEEYCGYMSKHNFFLDEKFVYNKEKEGNEGHPLYKGGIRDFIVE